MTLSIAIHTMDGVNRAVGIMNHDSSAYTQLGAPYTVRGLLPSQSDASDSDILGLG